MFSFFKKRVWLRDQLDGFYDIHSHLLWGVDDGCRDEEHTRKITAELVNLGFKGAYLTPHIIYGLYGNNTEEGLRARFAEMPTDLGLELRLAAEYFLDEKFLDHVNAETPMLTLAGDHILTEFSLGTNRVDTHVNTLFEAALTGKNIIIAHPERYAFLSADRNMHELEKLTSKGYALQLNLLSLTGQSGEKTRRIAEELLLGGHYTFVGSDIHSRLYINAIKEGTISPKIVEPLKELMENNRRLLWKK
jgi:tyrosine-protein phosphatase YwqE